MRLKSTTSLQNLCREIDKIVSAQVSNINTSGRETCLDIYNRLGTNNDWKQFRFRHKKFKEKEILVEILQIHYLNEEIKALFQLEEIQFVEKHCSLETRELFKSFIRNKGLLLTYIFESSRYWKNENELFGSLCAAEFTLKPYLKKIEDMKWINNPVNHSRHRGYRDKGSLGSSFIGHKEWKNDYQNYLIESQREERERVAKDTTQIVLGSLGG